MIGSLDSEGTEQLRFENAEALGQSCSVVEIASWPLQGSWGFLLRKRGGGSIEPLKTGGVWKKRPFGGAGSSQGLYQPPPDPPSCGGHRPPCVCTALCVHRLVYALPCMWTTKPPLASARFRNPCGLFGCDVQPWLTLLFLAWLSRTMLCWRVCLSRASTGVSQYEVGVEPLFCLDFLDHGRRAALKEPDFFFVKDCP